MNPQNEDSSNSQQNPQPYIFVDEDGTALRIYLQVEIPNRPKLIRRMRAAGASFASTDNAQICLVDPESDEGQLIIEGFGSSGNHAILHLDWASSCFDRGFALLARDNWGGHRLFGPDGPPANDRVLNGQKSPLPTPRHTPFEGPPAPPPTFQGIPIPQATPFQYATPSGIPTMPAPQALPAMIPPQMPNGAFPVQQPQINMNIPANLAQTVMDMISFTGMMPNMMPQFPFGFPQPSTGMFAPQHLPSHTPEPVSRASSSYHTAEYPGSRGITPSQSAPVNGGQHEHDPDRARKRPRYSEPILGTAHREDSIISDRAGPSGRKKSRRPKIFTDVNGQPLGFVVQIDLRNRMDIVQSIKNYGGIIKADIQDADYAILSQQSTTFNELYTTAKTVGTPVVQATFVYDCVDEGKVLDPKQYAFQDIPKAKRGRTSLSTPIKKESADVKPKSSSPKKASSSKVSPTKAKQAGSSKNANRTPSPTPPTKAVAYSGGKNRFTEEELDYAFTYALIMFKRDPDIAWSALMKRLSTKMPQHSAASWTQTLAKQRERYEDAQKKANIQRRKVQAQKKSEMLAAQGRGQAESSHDLSHTPTAVQSEPPGSPPPPAPSTVPPDFESEQFQAIVNTLASIVDDRSDEEVWVAMAEKYPKWTARDWRDYWDVYADWVGPEVQRRMQSD